MSNVLEFRVQYQDATGSWETIGDSFSTYNRAVERFLREAKLDPEYTHRIVRVTEEVVGTITGAREFGE